MNTKAPLVSFTPMRIKRLRRCLNPECTVRVAGGPMILRSTWVREYARMVCLKCGAITVVNPIGKVSADQNKHTFVARDGREGVEHISPKSRVLVPQ